MCQKNNEVNRLYMFFIWADLKGCSRFAETWVKISSTYNDQLGKLFYIYITVSRSTS